jgi:thymidine kinase
MNAGKSAQLLQTNFNYHEKGMTCMLLTAAVDTRYGIGKITSRLGLSADAHIFQSTDSLKPLLQKAVDEGRACVLIDEAQFLTRTQVGDICWAVDTLNIPVMAYGLRTDFQGHLFEGSSALMAVADDLRELRTICHCGKKATMVLRKDGTGTPTLTGDQVQIGGNATYETMCRTHWTQALEAAGFKKPLS